VKWPRDRSSTWSTMQIRELAWQVLCECVQMLLSTRLCAKSGQQGPRCNRRMRRCQARMALWASGRWDVPAMA
jgi:hypothetical protein